MGVYPAFGELGGGQLLAVVLFDVAPVDLVDESFEFFSVFLLVFQPILFCHLIDPEGYLVRSHRHSRKLQRLVQGMRVGHQVLAVIS